MKNAKQLKIKYCKESIQMGQRALRKAQSKEAKKRLQNTIKALREELARISKESA